MLRVWVKCLGNKNISVYDNFFSLGGDSLIGSRIINELKKDSINISVAELYEFETISECAKYITNRDNGQKNPVEVGEIE